MEFCGSPGSPATPGRQIVSLAPPAPPANQFDAAFSITPARGPQPLHAESLHHEALVSRLAGAVADLAQEVFLEADLRQMHPIAAARPVDVARRNLRQRDEGDAAVAEIGEADRVPGRHLRRLGPSASASMLCAVAVHHRFDHEAGLRHADRHRRRLVGRDRDADADREDVAIGRVALMLVDEHEAARVGEARDPLAVVALEAVDAAEAGDEHRELRGQLVRLLTTPSSFSSSTSTASGGDAVDLALVIHLMSRSRRSIPACPWCRRRRRGRDGRYRVRK